MKKTAVVLLAVCMLTAGVLSAYADDAAERSSKNHVLTEEEKALGVIGVPSGGEDIYEIKLKNSTGKNIVSFQIKDIYAGDYPKNMLPEGESFADGEERMLFFDVSPYDEKTEYTVKVVFEEGRYRTGTSWPLSDMEDAELLLGDVLHAVYTSCADGSQRDTEGTELMLRKAADEAKQAAEKSYSYDYEYDYDDGGYSGGGGSQGSSDDNDGCVGDDAILW